MTNYNKLNGYDLVYAISEETINKQLVLLSAMGMLPSEWNAEVKKGLYSIHGTLGTPEVKLNIPQSANKKAMLTIPLTKATLAYATVDVDDKGEPVVKRETTDISGSKLHLTASLALDDLAGSYKDSKRIPKTVKDQLNAFDDTMFSLSYLFMNLQDADLLTSYQLDTQGAVDLDSNPELVGQIKNLIKSFVDGLSGTDNPFVFGYSAQNKSPEASDATWKPVSVNYSTFIDQANPTLSSINYLMKTSTASSGGPGVFSNNWIESDDVQGTFVVAQELAMTSVVKKVAANLKIPAALFVQSSTRTFSAGFPNKSGGTTNCKITQSLGKNTISIGIVNGYQKNVEDKAGSGIGYIDGKISWTTTLTFSVDSKKGDILVASASTPVKTTRKNHPNFLGSLEEGLAIFADVLISIATFGQVNHVFENMVNDDWNTGLSADFSSQASALKSRVILPAGNELLFKDARFHNDGSLELTTTIKD